MMSEHRMLKSPPGQQGFAILLLQDLAVIPILLLVEALASRPVEGATPWYVGPGAVLVVLGVAHLSYLTGAAFLA